MRRGRLTALLVCLMFLICPSSVFSVEAQGGLVGLEKEERRERLLQLRSEIAYHDDLYFRKAAPVISDAAYDALKRELISLEALVGEGTQRTQVGNDLGSDSASVGHLMPMLSLEKAYSKSELIDFYERVSAVSGELDIAFLVEPKVDGMAVSALYERGVFVRALSRGDGKFGEAISENVLRISGFPKRLSGTNLPKRVELRGEVFVSYENFRKVNRERRARGAEAFSHPRSLAAGAVKLSDPEEVKARRLSVVFFGIGAVEMASPRSQEIVDFYELARDWGVPVLEETIEVKGKAALLKAVVEKQEERLGYGYPTDGTVVKVSSFDLQRRLGESRDAPHWALAYKSLGELVETRLLEITFQVGRLGVLTPVAELEEASLSGSQVRRASLHNLKAIESLDLRLGDSVFLKKAGEIIPQVVGVNFSKRDPGSQPFAIPEFCPSCRSRLSMSDVGRSLCCLNRRCPERVKRRLEHFVSRGAVSMGGWGPATLGGLVDRGYVRDVADLYEVDRAMLLELPHVGAATATRLLESREASKDAALWRFVFGLGIPGLGEVGSKDVAKSMGSLAELSRREAAEVYFRAEENQDELDRLVAVGVASEVSWEEPKARGPLVGKTFVLSGRLESFTRGEARVAIEKAGGNYRTTLSSSCDYLVVGDAPGAKVLEAATRGIETISEAEFLSLLGTK